MTFFRLLNTEKMGKATLKNFIKIFIKSMIKYEKV